MAHHPNRSDVAALSLLADVEFDEALAWLRSQASCPPTAAAKIGSALAEVIDDDGASLTPDGISSLIDDALRRAEISQSRLSG